MPLILGTNSIKDTGFNVDNSLRFNDGSSDYLSFTPSSTSNQKTWTVSCWVKRSALTSTMYIWGVNGDTSGHYFSELNFNSGDQLEFIQGGTVGDPYQTQMLTNARYRDPSAWLNIVVAVDTTQSTESNRFKMYVNGEQITSWAISNYPSLNENFRWHFVSGSDYPHSIGRTGKRNSNYFDGYICEWIDIDGTQLDANSFGEFDDSGIWKPIDISGLTLGTNGAYLDFEDSSSLGNSVGNSNNFTVNNLTSIDQSTDTCTNNFATMNPLDNYYQSATFSEGNLKLSLATSPTNYNTSTIGVSTGKWYWEVKYVSDTDGSSNYARIGVASQVATATNFQLGDQTGTIAYEAINGRRKLQGTQTTYGDTYAPGDIIGVALNLDDNEMTFYKNGTAQDSGTAFDISGVTNVTGNFFPAVEYNDSSHSGVFEFNFGNPPFSISSGNSDGNGYGNFEYSVPSGYYALNTKNLAEYG